MTRSAMDVPQRVLRNGAHHRGPDGCPLATHAAFAHGGYLWLIGGVEDAQRFVDHIWRAPIGADGRIGAWQAGASCCGRGSTLAQVTGAPHVGTFQD